MSTFSRSCLMFVPLWIASIIPAAGQSLDFVRPATSGPFLETHCLDCHQGDEGEGGLDLQRLGDDLSEPDAMARWVRIFDRVRDGEMPPPEAGDVDQNQTNAFLDSTSTWLTESQRRIHASRGRVQSRRLTNVQLERTLHDLLAIDVPLADQMPDEQRTDGFVNIADGQSMSHFQLETHLSVVDAALSAAFERAAENENTWDRQYNARQLSRENPEQRCRDPEMIDDRAVVWNSGLIFYGRITSTTMRRSGWYRITFTASAMNSPEDHGVWCTVRSGRCTSGAPLLSWIGAFEANGQPSEHTFEAWIPEDHMLEIRPADATLKRARFQGGQVGAGEGEPQNVPGLALHSMTIEEIHPGGEVSLVRRRLFGDLDVEIKKRGDIRLVSDQLAEDVVRQVRAFSLRAFRRPVSDEVLQPYLDLATQSLDQGVQPVEVLRRAYRAILCSPRFMYLVEPRLQVVASESTDTESTDTESWPLDDYALACRLSYLLWGSMPDDELFRLAEEGQLRDVNTLHDQVDRMLDTGRGPQFVKDFAGQWLDLVNIDFTEPDRKLYPDFDIVVQNAMLDETHRFLATLLDSNANVRKLIDADFTFLNSRLARYYGIDGVSGDRLQRVSLSAESHRGGLLAHGSIMKVTANGTNTSPVLRGIWVSEKVLGVPIPPPPQSVPAVEPDVRGAKTIREQLQKHLADDSCAVCHRKIDPPGYALENFDAAGRWRDRYSEFSGAKDRSVGKIDPGYIMADGRKFHDFEQFRSLIAEDPRPLARNFAEKLMVYGTGAPIDFADRQVIENIVDDVADHDYGMRSLLHAVVVSPTFLSK